MQSRPRPRLPKSAISAGVIQRAAIAGAIADLVAFHKGRMPERRLWGFSETELREIDLAVARELGPDAVDPKHYLAWMRKTQPVLAQPRLTNDALDLWHMLSQPEILEMFWPGWNPRTGTRGANPGISAKALLTLTACMGSSAHFDKNHRWLGIDRIRHVFEWIEATSAAATGGKANPYKVQSYEQVMRQVHKIGDVVPANAIATNVEMLKAMNALHPTSCVRLGIDGTQAKAWCRQIGSSGLRESEEAWIRRRAPKAGSRAYGAGDGKTFTTFWRGWYLVVLTDLATGLPLIWRVIDASTKEADAIIWLLRDLYTLWPECPTEAIVGDNAWDDEALVRECLVNYGVQLIARRTRDARLDAEHHLSRFDSESISHYTGTGAAYCRKHGVELVRVKSEFAPRDGLRPGEPSKEHLFRVRYACPNEDGCGGIRGLHMRRNWSILTPAPHARDVGREKEHAYRVALFARRNHSEAVFSALKLGRKLGLESADRTRTPWEPTVEALFALSLMMKTAFALADQRIQRGTHPKTPPPPLDAALAL